MTIKERLIGVVLVIVLCTGFAYLKHSGDNYTPPIVAHASIIHENKEIYDNRTDKMVSAYSNNGYLEIGRVIDNPFMFPDHIAFTKHPTIVPSIMSSSISQEDFYARYGR